MRGYGSFWVLIVLLAVLSVLVHLALWKWAVMRKLKARAKENPPAPPKDAHP